MNPETAAITLPMLCATIDPILFHLGMKKIESPLTGMCGRRKHLYVNKFTQTQKSTFSEWNIKLMEIRIVGYTTFRKLNQQCTNPNQFHLIITPGEYSRRYTHYKSKTRPSLIRQPAGSNLGLQ